MIPPVNTSRIFWSVFITFFILSVWKTQLCDESHKLHLLQSLMMLTILHQQAWMRTLNCKLIVFFLELLHSIQVFLAKNAIHCFSSGSICYWLGFVYSKLELIVHQQQLRDDSKSFSAHDRPIFFHKEKCFITLRSNLFMWWFSCTCF